MTRNKVVFTPRAPTAAAAFPFAGDELARWLQARAPVKCRSVGRDTFVAASQAETDAVRATRGCDPPRRYWAPAEPDEEGGVHDGRGMAAWLNDAHYIPTDGDAALAAASES